MIVREGKREDMSQLLGLAIVMHQESPYYSKYELNKEKLHNLLLWCMQSEDGFCIVAEDEMGEVVGGMIGGIGQHWFGGDKFGFDYALFLHPLKRHGRGAIKIIKKAFEVAKSKGAKCFEIANSTGYEPERVERLYEFVGMERVGGLYYREL